MIQLTPQMRMLVAVEPADFRKGIDGLARLCQELLEEDPFCGWVFVFRNRKATAVKLLVYDGQGFWLCHKRLERGAFQLLTTANDKEGIELDYSQMVRLLGGLDLRTGRRRKRYRRVG